MHLSHTLRASTYALLLAFASGAYAEQGAGASSGTSTTQGQDQNTSLKGRMQTSGQAPANQDTVGGISIGDEMLNRQVKNEQGQDMGKVADAIIDRYGRVQYVMLSPPSSMDVKGEFIAVPWHAFSEVKDGTWILPVAQERLASAPAFTKEQTPSLGQPETVTVIYTFYGIPVPKGGDQRADFAELDSNNDGYVSTSEAQASDPLHSRFQQADRNNDGRINRAEFSAFEGNDDLKDKTGESAGSGNQGSTTYTPDNP